MASAKLLILGIGELRTPLDDERSRLYGSGAYFSAREIRVFADVAPSRRREHRHMKTVGDVMHRGVIGCRPEASLAAVVRTMAAHRIHSVVVSGEGIITDAELAAALDRPPETTATSIARRAPRLDECTTLEQAVEALREQRSTHALVVRQGSQDLVGVLSTLDLADALAP